MHTDAKFVVNADGSVTRMDGTAAKVNIENEDLYSERSRLVYESSHPERFSPAEIAQKRARIDELNKILGAEANVLKAGKSILLKKLAAQQNRQQPNPTVSDVVSHAKQNG